MNSGKHSGDNSANNSGNNPGNNWQQDPRLRMMSQEKLDYITQFADRVSKLPKDQLLPAFMAMQLETSKSGIQFNDQETDLLVSVLSAGMSPAEKKRLDTLRLLAKKLAARSS